MQACYYAIKFTLGGQVKIRLEQVNNQTQISVIDVIDTGKGISATFLPHIFASFRQEDRLTQLSFQHHKERTDRWKGCGRY